MDFKAPIDITAVLGAVKKHQNLLKAVDKLDANEILQHFTAVPGVTDSIELGKIEGGTVSSKYTGTFTAGKSQGKVVPRRLVVRPVVMEMQDEPERYRRSYLAEVPGELRKDHPFELWLLNHGYELASNDLANAVFVAKYVAGSEATEITDSFDGVGSIVTEGVVTEDISSVEGNVFATGELNRANVGEKLLDMYRHMPRSFRRKRNIKMFVASEVGDMYDDWRKDEGTMVLGLTEEATDTEYLLGSHGKCQIVRVDSLPDDSQFVLLTTKENICYGFDKASDFKSIRPFQSGNPYQFTAAGKYVIGFQFVSVHASEFCVNDRPVDPHATNEFGYITVTIPTTEAIAEGAAWRIKGESIWRKSGETVAVKGGVQKSIEFAPAKGYTTPGEVSSNPGKGKNAAVSQVYSPAH